MGMTLFMEAFVTIHMSVFVLLPLSKLISKDNSRKIFWTLFGVRIAILLFFDFFITTGIAIVDFMAVFVGAFIVTPIAMKKGVWNQKLSKQSGKEKVQTAAETVIHAPAADETPAAQHPLNGLPASFCRTPAAYPGTGPDPCRNPGSHKDLPHPLDGRADPKQPAQTH